VTGLHDHLVNNYVFASYIKNSAKELILKGAKVVHQVVGIKLSVVIEHTRAIENGTYPMVVKRIRFVK
jgi:hypothetical protein